MDHEKNADQTEQISEKVEDEFFFEDDGEPLHITRRHKIRMNRIFRENVGGNFLPFPEVDNTYERVRSRIVLKLHLEDKKIHRHRLRAWRRKPGR